MEIENAMFIDIAITTRQCVKLFKKHGLGCAAEFLVLARMNGDHCDSDIFTLLDRNCWIESLVENGMPYIMADRIVPRPMTREQYKDWRLRQEERYLQEGLSWQAKWEQLGGIVWC